MVANEASPRSHDNTRLKMFPAVLEVYLSYIS